MSEINNSIVLVETEQELNKNTDELKEPTCIFKKKTTNNNKNIRKRKNDISMTEETKEKVEDNDKDQDEDEQSKKKLKTKVNVYTSSTATTTVPLINDDIVSYESSGNTKSLISDSDHSTMEIIREEKKEQVSNDDGTYKGMKNYNTFIPKNEEKKGSIKSGPTRSNNYRISSRVDYQPDVCKDYKQSGQCTFGDSCKFLHDRGDYKLGWQIDKEYEEEQKKKRNQDPNSSSSSSINTLDDQDSLPFACFICKSEFNNPIMTPCKHFFCESCALSQNKKSKKCALCNKPTNGSFTFPQKLLQQLVLKSKAHFQNKLPEKAGE